MTFSEQQQHQKQQEKREPTPNKEQQAVIDCALAGKSLFFTGPGGTGKSFVIDRIKTGLEEKGKIVAVTASTGRAADGIDGITLHRFAGIGYLKDVDLDDIERTAQKLAEKHRKFGELSTDTPYHTWKNTDVLFIDEISMIQAELLDIISRVGSLLRDDERPFGGVQVIIAGDFLQLPPVPPDGEKQKDVKFAFESEVWAQMEEGKHLSEKECRRRIEEGEALFPKLALIHSIRAQNDKTLESILKSLRFGKLHNQNLIRRIKDCKIAESAAKVSFKKKIFTHSDPNRGERTETDDGGIVVRSPGFKEPKYSDLEKDCHMFTSNRKCSDCNDAAIDQLPTRKISIFPVFSENASDTAETIEGIIKSHHIEDPLKLKVGSMVMITRNLHDEELYNGQIGIVRAILIDSKFFKGEESDSEQKQVSETQESKEYSINDYDYWLIEGESRLCYNCAPLDWVMNREKQKRKLENPLLSSSVKIEVEIHNNSGSVRELIVADSWMKEVFINETRNEITVEQLPLVPAYGITIHKAQGMSMDKAVCDLGGILSPGHVYVALSRAKTLKGLHLLSFPNNNNWNYVDQRAVAFHEAIENEVSEPKKGATEEGSMEPSITRPKEEAVSER